MKILFILCSLFLLCCSEKEALPAKVQPNNKSFTIERFEDLKNFKGNWILKAYIDSLLSNKSPYKSQPNDMSNVVINDYTINEKTINFVWFLHDGASNSIRFNREIKAFTVFYEKDGNVNDIYNIEFKIANADTLLSLYDLQKKSQTLFQRIPKNSKSYINYLLVSGKYSILFDKISLATDSTVVFNNNGTVTGFKDFREYQLFLDYNDDIPQRDLIYFEKDGSRKWYSWELKKDTLNFFQFNQDEINYESTIKEKVISLKRRQKF